MKLLLAMLAAPLLAAGYPTTTEVTDSMAVLYVEVPDPEPADPSGCSGCDFGYDTKDIDAVLECPNGGRNSASIIASQLEEKSAVCMWFVFTGCGVRRQRPDCSFSVNLEIQFPASPCINEVYVDAPGVDPRANRIVNSWDYGTLDDSVRCKEGEASGAETGDLLEFKVYSDSAMSNLIGKYVVKIKCANCTST